MRQDGHDRMKTWESGVEGRGQERLVASGGNLMQYIKQG